MRLADTSGQQCELHNAGLLTFEYRKSVLVRLLKRAPVICAEGLSAEMEQVRLRVDDLIGYAGITKPCCIIGQRYFPIGAIAGDKAVNAYTSRGCSTSQARSAQDLATVNRHSQKLPQRLGPV